MRRGRSGSAGRRRRCRSSASRAAALPAAASPSCGGEGGGPCQPARGQAEEEARPPRGARRRPEPQQRPAPHQRVTLACSRRRRPRQRPRGLADGEFPRWFTAGGPDSPASSRRSPGSRRNSGASGRSPKGGRRGKGSTHASEPPPEPKGTAAICGPRLLQAFEANPPVLQKVRASLQESPPLAALSLEHSALAAAGAVSLAKALLRNTSLVLLELKGNFIGDAGVQRIVAALEGSPGLARLGLSWNCIGDAGGMRVAESVGRLQGLRDLDLSYNRIGDASTDIMCMAMEASFSLKQADLRSNQFGPDSQGRLLEACAGKVALHLEGEPRALHVAAHKAEAKQRAPRGARGGGPRRASLSPAPSGRRGSRASQMR
ncbi:unnamed protein product [Prorocentrum cordatum]|uniref:Uncharacterized protein n=1 Tax=Prorocentrum cordatum TaxID=2364126 RepID=A0ABN9Q281_9DINO|nr:unnamed protein product [Polarella glacialis]